MKYVLAVSGGIDSAVLLDQAVRGELFAGALESKDFVVAHFDHGIRAVSAEDAALVRDLAAKYQMKFVLGRGSLGKNASEELARAKRYEFLRRVLRETGAQRIVTAHHQDDLIETILINLIRGTGWRGLAPMWSRDIKRPLINKSKAELAAYAMAHDLCWAEDETNYSSKYLRNRVRNLTARLTPEQRQKILKLHQKQAELRRDIEKIISVYKPHDASSLNSNTSIANDNSYHYQLAVGEIVDLPEIVALEILKVATQNRLTRPQLKNLRTFLGSAKSGDIMQPGGGLQVGIYQGAASISHL